MPVKLPAKPIVRQDRSDKRLDLTEAFVPAEAECLAELVRPAHGPYFTRCHLELVRRYVGLSAYNALYVACRNEGGTFPPRRGIEKGGGMKQRDLIRIRLQWHIEITDTHAIVKVDLSGVPPVGA